MAKESRSILLTVLCSVLLLADAALAASNTGGKALSIKLPRLGRVYCVAGRLRLKRKGGYVRLNVKKFPELSKILQTRRSLKKKLKRAAADCRTIAALPTAAPTATPPPVAEVYPGSLGFGEWPAETPAPVQTAVPPLGYRFPDGSSEIAIARLDHIPFQTYRDDFYVGVLAFHINAIRAVSFAADGGAWAEALLMANHPDIGVPEYVAKVRLGGMADGAHELRWRACPYRGVCRDGGMKFWVNRNSSLREPAVYLSPNGDDNNDGLTAQFPKKTMPAVALALADGNKSVDGATVYLLPGIHEALGFPYPISNVKTEFDGRWFTITTAPGVSRDQVTFRSPASGDHRAGNIKLLKLDNLTIQPPGANYASFTDGTRKWYSRCYVDGLARGSAEANGIFAFGTAWTGGKYITDSFLTRLNNSGGFAIMRNTQVKELLSDAFSASLLVVNSSVEDINKLDTGAHPDVYQVYGAVDNAILYRVTAVNEIDAQGIFMTTGVSNNFALVESNFVPQAVNGFSISLPEGGVSRHFYLKDSYVGGSATTARTTGFANAVVENTAFKTGQLERLLLNPGWYLRPKDVPEAATLAVSAVSAGRVDASWNRVPGAVSYGLERKRGSSDFVSVYQGALTTVTDSPGVEPGQEYVYRLRTSNEFGDSLSAEVAVNPPFTDGYYQSFDGLPSDKDLNGSSVPYWYAPLNYSATRWRTLGGTSIRTTDVNFDSHAQYAAMPAGADTMIEAVCNFRTSHPLYCGVFGRSTLQMSPIQNKAGDRYEARLYRDKVELVKRLGETLTTEGASSVLASLACSGAVSGSQYAVSLELRGNSLTMSVQRQGDGFYLAADGSWASTPQSCLASFDADLPNAGYQGVIGRTGSSGTTLTIEAFQVEEL